MKKILYFLIGFCLAFVPAHMVYAADTVSIEAQEPTPPTDWTTLPNDSWRNMGVMESGAWAAFDSMLNSTPTDKKYAAGSGWNSVVEARLEATLGFDVPSIAPTGGTLYAYWFTYYPNSKYNSPKITLFWFNCKLPGQVEYQQADADNDGIPDAVDATPNSSDAYQFRLIANFMDSDGNLAAQVIKLQDGTYRTIGLTDEEITTGYDDGTYTAQWIDDPNWTGSWEIEEGGDMFNPNGESGVTTTTTATAQDIINQIGGSTPSDPNTSTPATGISTGTTSDISDNDTALLTKIVNNTNASNQNDQTLANYLKQQNQLLTNIKTNTTDTVGALKNISGGGGIVIGNTDTGDDTSDDTTEEEVDTTGVTSAIDAAAQTSDTTTALAEANQAFTQEVTIEDVPNNTNPEEGGNIATERWDFQEKIMNLIDNNPISDALGGVEITAAGNCSYTFNFKNHAIPLTICGYESQLNNFGSILLMMSSFISLMIIIRG